MSTRNIPPLTPQLWIAYLLDAVGNIADKEHQEQRWLAPDARAWERPEELICVIDDCVFDGFLRDYFSTFTPDQKIAAVEFQDEFSHYCEVTPGELNPSEVLADPRWEKVRQKASAFVSAFRDKWPIP